MPSGTSRLPADLYPDHVDLDAARHEQADPRAGVPLGAAGAPLYGVLIALLGICRAALVRSVKVLGRESIEDGARVLVSDQPRGSDAFLLPFIFHGTIHSRGQEGTSPLPVLGKALTHAGQILFRRASGSQAVLVQAADLLAKDEEVLVYPQGVRTHGGEMRRGLTGAARRSHRTRVRMPPVGVYLPPANTRIIHGRFDNPPTISC